jgi:starch synthase
VRILFATAEFAPVAVVGGLASASAGLVHELRRQGADVDVVLPDYGAVPLAAQSERALEVPAWAGPARVRSGTHATAGPLHLVDLPGLARPHPYLAADGTGWADNDRRFLAFSQAVAALARERPPNVLHLNDWHTAAVLATGAHGPPSVLSVHNLAYQGVCDPTWLQRLGPRAAAYSRAEGCNPMAGGLALADAIVAVSPTYAREITEPENGHGLDELLVGRGDALVGIRNGIDTDSWDPARDPHLPANFRVSNLAARATNRSAVRTELGLPDADIPLIAMVTRLTEQKGVDLVLPLAAFLAELPAQLAVLGAGERGLADDLVEAARAHPDDAVFVEGYDEGLGRRLFGGADLFLMPSRFEPCGLAQMQAMRYGAIPVVTGVGGLLDTVVDADRDPMGNGFVAVTPDTVGVLDALHRAVRTVGSKGRRQRVQRAGMKADWSWREPAARHLALYRRLVAR